MPSTPGPDQRQPKRGRPRNDDDVYVRGILWERLLGHDLNEATPVAATALVSASREAAAAAAAEGGRKPVITLREAAARLSRAVAAEIRRVADGPLTGLPPRLHAMGKLLGEVAARDGYQAGRTLLVEGVAIHNFIHGKRHDHQQLLACLDETNTWIAEIEAQSELVARMKNKA